MLNVDDKLCSILAINIKNNFFNIYYQLLTSNFNKLHFSSLAKWLFLSIRYRRLRLESVS